MLVINNKDKSISSNMKRVITDDAGCMVKTHFYCEKIVQLIQLMSERQQLIYKNITVQ